MFNLYNTPKMIFSIFCVSGKGNLMNNRRFIGREVELQSLKDLFQAQDCEPSRHQRSKTCW